MFHSLITITSYIALFFGLNPKEPKDQGFILFFTIDEDRNPKHLQTPRTSSNRDLFLTDLYLHLTKKYNAYKNIPAPYP